MITIKPSMIKMSVEEYNEFLDWIGGDGEIGNKEGIVEIYKDGSVEVQEVADGKLNPHTYYLYDFYRPDNSEDPDWEEIIDDIKQFIKERD